MKLVRLSIPAVFGLLVFINSSAVAQKDSKALLKEGYKRYGIESGRVESVGKGSMMETRETIEFDRWGLRETKLTITDIKVGTFTQSTRSLALMDGETTVNVDLETKQGTRIKNNMMIQIVDKMGSKDMTKASEDLMKKMGGKKVGSESILGQPCEIWEIRSLGSKTWVWNNISLQNETKLAGIGMTITAVNVEANPRIPESTFAIPDSIIVKEGGSPLEMLKDIKKKGKKG